MKMSAKIYDSFRANVRSRMVELEIRQKDLAKKLKKTPGYISQILSGTCRPSFEILEDFALALECEPADLISRKKFARSA